MCDLIKQLNTASLLMGNRRQAEYFRLADPSHPPGKRSGKNPRVVWPGEWGACRVLGYTPAMERLLKKRGVRCVQQGDKLVVDKRAYKATIRKVIQELVAGDAR